MLTRTYAKLRETRGSSAADYLSHSTDPIGRKRWTRLRSGVSNLRVHTGRFIGMPWGERVCKHCSEWAGRFAGCVHETEDETHLVMRCDKYRVERAALYVDMGWGPLGNTSSDGEVFQWLVGDGPQGETADDKAVRCTAVMRFLRRVWSQRLVDSECHWAGSD